MKNTDTFRDFQDETDKWMKECFGDTIPKDKAERNYRFLEEALELVQSCNIAKEDVIRLVNYTFNRPIGEITQEIGGTMVTLSALCSAHNVSLGISSNLELERCFKNIEKIRIKQANKEIKNESLP